ncbi:MAG: hypothetical protein H7Y08_06080, partial [Rhizobiaceae bacterium]|nr:hypothetical protein [Rhizobiaceae bacterium]
MMKPILFAARRAFSRLRVAAVVALAAIVVPTAPASAQEFLANQIEGLISSETMRVEIEGLSGALTGNIRIDSVTVSDPQGVYLTARDLAMDWSPLAIVRSRVDVEALTAASIVLERLPAAAPADPNAEPSSGLPNITADIQRIAITEFVLGEAIAGVRARLSMNARLALENDPTRLETELDIQRLDQPGEIRASIAFAPEENRLGIDVDASEPAGGLVATLLALPGAPPVALTINGQGPLADFMANGQLTVGTEPAATLTARVADVAEGRSIAASLNVAAERFVPDAYRAYVDGGATLDVQAVLRDDGVAVIDQAALASGRISASVTGTLDRAGPQTALEIAVSGRDGAAIPLRFGAEPSQTVLDIASLNGTVAGALDAATIALNASAPTAGYGPYVASDLTARVSSEGFDIAGLTGPLAIELAAASVASPEGVTDRFLEGPVRIAANGALGPNGITVSGSQVTTDVANAAITGTAALNFSTFDLTLSSDFETLALSAAVIPLSGDRLQLGGSVSRAVDGALGVRDLAIRSERLIVDGTASLSGETITADVTGTVDAPEGENAAISGQAQFALTASGPSAQPDVDITLNSNGLRVNGRELADLRVAARGAFVSATPSGTVEISGTLDGAPLSGNATVETLPSGERRISNLAIRQAANAITGDLILTEAFAPVGTLDVAFADVGPLAALALQQMNGDLRGTIALSVNAADFPVADIDLVSTRLAVGGNVLSGADIDLSVEDYLGRPFPTGAIRATRIEAGGATVEALALDLARQGEFTRLDATARANAIPVTRGGQAQIAPTETVIALDALTADIPDAAVRLREPARLRIADGTTTLGALALDIGAGSIIVQGTAGATLELTAGLTDVPVAAANPFVTGLDATGTLTGNAAVLGAADDPEARFEINATGVETSQTRAAALAPVGAILSGQYAGGTLELQTARIDLGDGAVTARGRIGEALDVTLELDAVPAALANGFVEGIGASGALEGSVRATGSIAEPSLVFDLTGTGITAREVAEAGIAPLTLDVAGGYANDLLTLETARANIGTSSLTASGTVGQTVDLDLVMTELPVGLANAFVPGLKASGTLSGTATASGDLVNPGAVFDITGTRITAEEIAAGGIPPIELRLAGSFANGTAELQTAVANIGEASLTATGTVGRTLDLDLALNAVPVGLANGFVPGLDATGTVSGTATATGTLADPAATFALTGRDITAARIAASGIDPLSLDLAGSVADMTATIETARVTVGDGSLTASGTVGEALDLQVAMTRLPVGLVNGFVPDLGASGTLSGNATATGSLADPQATFQLSGEGISAAQIEASGIDPLVLSLDGSFAAGTATIRTARADIGDGSLTASGTIGQALDLDVSLEQLPVALANGFVPDLGASGTISGSAKATGSLADPAATFRIDGSNITATQIAASGVAPLELDVSGRCAAGTATLETALATIGDGSIEASGTVGQSLDLVVRLNALPVGLVNGFVPGLDATGTISGNAEATGSIANPSANFTIDGSGITARQVRASGVAPIELDLSGNYAAGTATIETARATIGDGLVEATGTVGRALDVDVTITRLPVGLANGFVPDLDARGTVSGTASATGSLAAPDAVFDISASDVSTGQTRAAGAPA